MGSPIKVRAAQPSDVSAITAIYAPQVRRGTASFEVDPPDTHEMLRRRVAILELGLPYLVAEVGNEIAGYAYATRFRSRAAYRFTAENSVYVAESYQRRGIGRALMEQLIVRCAEARMREMIAVIANPSGNAASVLLHEAVGFREVGILRRVGEKFGQVLDVMLMQRSLINVL